MPVSEPYQILDDLLPRDELILIQESLNDRSMPFYWHDDIDYEEPTSDILNFGLSHQMFSFKTKERSEWLPSYLPIVNHACSRIDRELVELLRMRMILLTNVGKEHVNRLHVDIPDKNCITFVYYPEETDGDFVIGLQNRDVRISPLENRCIVMFENIGHYGSNPIQHRRRVVINANVIVR